MSPLVTNLGYPLPPPQGTSFSNDLFPQRQTKRFDDSIKGFVCVLKSID